MHLLVPDALEGRDDWPTFAIAVTLTSCRRFRTEALDGDHTR